MWRINTFQAIMFMSAGYMPLTYYFFARTAVEHSGYYGFWAIIATVLVGLLLGFLHRQLNLCFPGLSGADYYTVVFGKFMGKILVGIYVPLYILFIGLSIHFYVMTMKAFLPNTPIAAITGALMIVACFGTSRGLEALARKSSIVATLTIFGNLTTMLFLILSGENRPHVVFAIPQIMPVMHGVYYLFPLFMGFSISTMINPHVEKQSYSIWAVLCNVPMIIGNFYMNISVLGYDAITRLQYPFTYVIQLLRLSGFLIERLGITVVIVATAFTCSFVANHLWALSVTTSRLLGQPQAQYHRYLVFIAVPIYVVGVFLDEGQDQILLQSVLVPMSWIVLFALPILALLVAKMKQLPKRIDKYRKRYLLQNVN